MQTLSVFLFSILVLACEDATSGEDIDTSLPQVDIDFDTEDKLLDTETCSLSCMGFCYTLTTGGYKECIDSFFVDNVVSDMLPITLFCSELPTVWFPASLPAEYKRMCLIEAIWFGTNFDDNLSPSIEEFSSDYLHRLHDLNMYDIPTEPPDGCDVFTQALSDDSINAFLESSVNACIEGHICC
jgi:hypothetical protein